MQSKKSPAVLKHTKSPFYRFFEQKKYLRQKVDKNKTKLKHNNMPSFEMEEAMYASFEIQGVQGDVVRFVQWAYQEWLPSSGFSTTTNPSFAIFRKSSSFSGGFSSPLSRSILRGT